VEIFRNGYLFNGPHPLKRLRPDIEVELNRFAVVFFVGGLGRLSFGAG
jgi:hypothetical protein